jgi:thymidylate synthase ThyX
VEPLETFSPQEREALAPYFTDLDGPVFALVNLPEVVKGALFARYSRSAKSLRRLFLTEFLDQVRGGGVIGGVGEKRATDLYEKVFLEYGDDSVAQLGGVHLACEGVSNVLTKVLEWGRLMAYLEQSTRYVPYTDRPGGRWKYTVPPEIADRGGLRERFRGTMDLAFETYASLLARMREFFERRFPRAEGEPARAWRMTTRAKALDAVRGLLPAATRSNLGIYGTGQAYEALLLRMRANPLGEVRDYAARMLAELRKVIPAFMQRVDREDRGVAWSRYLAATREATARVARERLGRSPEERPVVTLTDHDPDGELKVVAAALYSSSDLPDDQILRIVREMSPEDRARVLRAYVGERANRRHRPGRAFERTSYRFDVLSDYGAFRDLQRHRILTLEWQRLSPRHGYVLPPEVEEEGGAGEFRRVMEETAALHDAIAAEGLPEVAPYAVPMAYRVRYYMEMNAREAMHVIELRTTPQGHPAYRRIGQEMHRLIAESAGHRGIADAMGFADHSAGEGGRRAAERTAAERREEEGGSA